MNSHRIIALSLAAVLIGVAPALAQNAPQTPPAPPAGAPAVQRRGRVYRTGPGMANRVVVRRTARGPGQVTVIRRRFGGGRGPMGRGMAGRRGPAVMGFGATAGLRGPLFGFGAGLAQMVNNPNFRQQLNITGAQAAQIRQQALNYQVAQIHSRANLQVDTLQLRQLLTAQNPDSAAINQKLEQISAAQLAQRKQAVAYLLAVRKIFTRAQRQKLQQMRQAPLRRGGRGAAAPSAPAPAPAPQPNP